MRTGPPECVRFVESALSVSSETRNADPNSTWPTLTGRQREIREVPDNSGMVPQGFTSTGQQQHSITAGHCHWTGHRVSSILAWPRCHDCYHRPSPNYGINAQTGQAKKSKCLWKYCKYITAVVMDKSTEPEAGDFGRVAFSQGTWSCLPYLDATLGQGSLENSNRVWRWRDRLWAPSRSTPGPLSANRWHSRCRGVVDPGVFLFQQALPRLPQFFRPQVPAVHDLSSLRGRRLAKKQRECLLVVGGRYRHAHCISPSTKVVVFTQSGRQSGDTERLYHTSHWQGKAERDESTMLHA